LKKLSELGIKTIINLRGASDETHKQQAEAESSGLRYFNIPMSALGRPSDEQVERALAIIDTRENWPVFVHCQRGADRTGVVIAVYRISHERWTEEQAIAEAKRFGMAGIQFRKKGYISDYYKRRQDAR
jgi:protein tyrosine/serine phosphatase